MTAGHGAAPSARRPRRRAPRPRRRTPPPPPKATQIIMAIDSIGPGFNPHLLSDQSPVNAAISVAGAAQLVPAGRRIRTSPTGLAVGARPHAAGVGGGDQREPVHRHLQDPARGAVDRQRPDRRRRLLVPVAADGQPARRRRSRGLRPDHRRAVGRGRQDGGGDVLAAVPGVAGAVQRHPARAHRQGRARRLRRRAGPGAAGDRRPVPGGEHRPAARRDPAGPQRPLLGRARQARPDPVPARRSARRARRFDPQRRHPGRPGARRRGGLRAAVARSPTCAPRASSRRGSCS